MIVYTYREHQSNRRFEVVTLISDLPSSLCEQYETLSFLSKFGIWGKP